MSTDNHELPSIARLRQVVTGTLGMTNAGIVDDVRGLLAAYDTRSRALAYAKELGGQVIRAEAQAVRDLEQELVGVRSQLDAVRALAAGLRGDYGPIADEILAALTPAVCPGCEMADSNGADGWVEHRGQQWHGACVAVETAEKAGLL